MADAVKVVEFKVNTKDAINQIQQLNALLEDNKRQQKELKDATKDGWTEEQRASYARLKEAQKTYTREMQVLSKEVQNNLKLDRQKADSLAGLRAQLSNLTAAYDALSRAEREGTKGAEYKKQINEITNELKGAEEATQRYYRNVGNYANAVGTALGQHIPVLSQLKMMWVNLADVVKVGWTEIVAGATAMKGATTATQFLSGALKILKGLLISTGIGAIVVALGSLVTYLSRTQAGVELARKAMAGLSATFDVILDRIAMLGGAIVQLFKGDFVQAAETAKAAFKGVGAEIREEAQQAIKLSEAMQSIEKREIALTAQMAASKVQLAELKRIADDTTRSYEEREEAARKALGIEVDLAAKAKNLGEERIANMMNLTKGSEELNRVLSMLGQGKGTDEIIASLGMSESTVKDYQELVNVFNSYQQKILEFTEKQVEGNNKLNSIRKERLASEKAAIEEMQKLDAELSAEVEQFAEEGAKMLQKEWELRLATIVKGTEEEYALRAEALARERDMQLAEENLTAEARRLIWVKYNQDIAALDDERQQNEMEQMRLAWENKIAEAQLQGENTLQLEVERRKAELDALHQMEGESDAEFYARQLEARQAYAEAQQRVTNFEVAVEQAKMEAISRITDGIGRLFESFAQENKAMAIASKVMALAEIAINTGKAIAAGTASAAGVPFPGNLVAIATTVTTVLANVASAIKTVKSAKFATGGYVSGAGTGTSDSIPAHLSNGESVNTALSTAMFSPLYSALNQMGGGAPIIPRSASEVGSIVEGEDMLARAVAKGVSALHPVVSVEEINRVSDRAAFVKTLGDV